MNQRQKRVIRLFHAWKDLEAKTERAESRYQHAFCKLTDKELIKVVPATEG